MVVSALLVESCSHFGHKRQHSRVLAGVVHLAKLVKLQTLTALAMPAVPAPSWRCLGSLGQLTRLELSWQGEQSLQLLHSLAHLPLEEVTLECTPLMLGGWWC